MSKKSNVEAWLKKVEDWFKAEDEVSNKKVIDCLNVGTKNEIIIKKLLLICLLMLVLYRLGYAVGTFFAHIGL